ncbi:MAG: MlaA family lipoprotein [Ostreibacterium sp.]
MIKMIKRVIPVAAYISIVSLVGCSNALESYNRGMYKTNRVIDQYTLKPIAKTYRAITPDPVEHSINNFFNNVGEVKTFVNSLLQGKLHNAAVSSARFVWNTTLGLGGLFDVATTMNLKADQEDFGQTLQTWGLPTGPYVVLPLLGPSTVTDTVGAVGNFYTSPISQYEDWSSHYVREGVTGLEIINGRAQLLGLEKLLKNATTDEYGFVKSAYLQNRAALVRDGKESKALDNDLDNLFDDK